MLRTVLKTAEPAPKGVLLEKVIIFHLFRVVSPCLHYGYVGMRIPSGVLWLVTPTPSISFNKLDELKLMRVALLPADSSVTLIQGEAYADD